MFENVGAISDQNWLNAVAAEVLEKVNNVDRDSATTAASH